MKNYLCSIFELTTFFLKQEIDDADSTLLSNAADEETNSKSGIGDDGFEVVTLESDYQVTKCMGL